MFLFHWFGLFYWSSVYGLAGIDDVHRMQAELCGQRECYLSQIICHGLPISSYHAILSFWSITRIVLSWMQLYLWKFLPSKIFHFAVGLINILPFTPSLINSTCIKTYTHIYRSRIQISLNDAFYFCLSHLRPLITAKIRTKAMYKVHIFCWYY